MERKRRIILIGRSTAGKTTLCQRINHEELQYHKTQTVQIVNQSMMTHRASIWSGAIFAGPSW